MPISISNLASFTKPCEKAITLDVRYDTEKIRFLNAHVTSIAKKLGDEFHKTRQLGSQMKALARKKAQKKVRFGVPHESGLGRLRPLANSDKSYVEITRPVRQFLVKEFATDIDIKNCHLEYIQYIYEFYMHDKLEELEYWNKNREDIFKTMIDRSSKPINRDDAKKLGFTFLYQGSVDKQFDELGLDKENPELVPIYDLVSKLTTKCRELSNQIKKDFPEMWDKLPYCKDKGPSRKDAGKFSSFMQNIERLCVTEIYNATKSLNLKTLDFCYDGILVCTSDWDFLSPEQAEALCSLSMKYIKDNLGMDLQILDKPMEHPKVSELERWFLGSNELSQQTSACLDIPDSKYCNLEDFNKISDKDFKTYDSTQAEIEAKIKYLNQHVAFIASMNCFFVRNTSLRWVPHRKTDLETAFLNYTYDQSNSLGQIVKLPIMNLWLKSELRQTYERVEWCPWTIHPPSIPNNTLNTFMRLKHEYDPEFQVDMSYVQPWLDHLLHVWACDDLRLYDYIIGWFANIVQNPHRKNGTNLIVRSVREGAGKNTVTDFFGIHVLGYEHYRQSSNIDDLFKKFNANAETCLLTILDEVAQNGAGIKNYDRIKDVTTRVHVTIEPKGVNSYIAPDRNNNIFTTNNDYTVKSTDSDRRNVLIDIATDKIGDTQYWNNLHCYSTNEAGLHMFHYLCRLDLSDFNPRNIPMTEWKRDLLHKFCSAELKTLADLCDTEMIHSVSLMNIYNSKAKRFQQHSNVKAFNNFWTKYTGWDKKRVLVNGVQKIGYKLNPGQALETARQITRDPGFEFATYDVWLEEDAPDLSKSVI